MIDRIIGAAVSALVLYLLIKLFRNISNRHTVSSYNKGRLSSMDVNKLIDLYFACMSQKAFSKCDEVAKEMLVKLGDGDVNARYYMGKSLLLQERFIEALNHYTFVNDNWSDIVWCDELLSKKEFNEEFAICRVMEVAQKS
jgi:hypothetical protein